MNEFAGITIPQSLEEIISPQNTALIVYDMQVGIVHQIKNGPEISKRVRRLLTAARGAGIRTFFTRHMSLPKELMGAFQCRTAMAWQRADSMEKVKPMFLRESPGFQIVPELQPLENWITMSRSRFVYGLDRVPDDRLNWSPGGEARTPLALD